MYRPPHFALDDRDVIASLMREHAFACLVVHDGERLVANHAPVVTDPEPGPHGRLRFHLARANPLAAALDGTRPLLAVFTGPQAYVSPDWYASEHRVPTWNYVVVHAHGRPRPLDDVALVALLDALAEAHEGRLDKSPWRNDKLPPSRFAEMRRAIVGFEMPIEALDAKAKLGQNMSAADRAGAAAALEASLDPAHHQLARWMDEVDRD